VLSLVATTKYRWNVAISITSRLDLFSRTDIFQMKIFKQDWKDKMAFGLFSFTVKKINAYIEMYSGGLCL
jgi:uncharacterized protein YlxP (DUF503 family)